MSYQFYKEIRHLDKHPAYQHAIPYSVWRERTMELLQKVFTPMYSKIFEPNWNNSMFATVRKNYLYYDCEQGIYEIYLPTVIKSNGKMSYSRIIIKLYDKLDQSLINDYQVDLQTPYIRPAGNIDSETIIHIAKTTTDGHKQTLREAWKKGGRKEWFKKLLRGFKHIKRRGYFTPVIVCDCPEIAVKRMLSLVYNFMKKRTIAFIKKLKLQDWMYKEYLEKKAKSALLMLVEPFSDTIRQILKNLLEISEWLGVKLKDLYAEKRKQTVQKMKIKPLINEIKEIVSVYRRENTMKNKDIPDPPIIKQLAMLIRCS